MPQVKNYSGKGKKAHQEKRRPHREAQDALADHDHQQYHEEIQQALEPSTIPAEDADVMMGAVEQDINTEAQNEGISPDMTEADVEAEVVAEAEMVAEGGADFGDEPSEHLHHEEKIHLEFYGSELIRQKAPKVMEIADTVADEWVKDGNFQGLPVGNPIAQMAAATALRKAKDVEKKLEEKGVFAMAKMGLEFVKSKIEKR